MKMKVPEKIISKGIHPIWHYTETGVIVQVAVPVIRIHLISCFSLANLECVPLAYSACTAVTLKYLACGRCMPALAEKSRPSVPLLSSSILPISLLVWQVYLQTPGDICMPKWTCERLFSSFFLGQCPSMPPVFNSVAVLTTSSDCLPSYMYR